MLRHSVRVCHLDMTFELSDTERTIACAYSNHAKHTQISTSIETPENMPGIWFKKREYRLSEPSSFLLFPVIIHHNENADTSGVTTWCGYDVMCDFEITASNTIKGTVTVTFLERYDGVVPVFVLVIYNGTINGVEYGPYQELTCQTGYVIWRDEPLSEEERNNENGVRIEVRVIELHC